MMRPASEVKWRERDWILDFRLNWIEYDSIVCVCHWKSAKFQEISQISFRRLYFLHHSYQNPWFYVKFREMPTKFSNKKIAKCFNARFFGEKTGAKGLKKAKSGRGVGISLLSRRGRSWYSLGFLFHYLVSFLLSLTWKLTLQKVKNAQTSCRRQD